MSRAAAGAQAADRALPLVVVLFLASLLVPIVLSLGTLRLSPYRIVLLAAFVPLLLRLLQGTAGRLRSADACVGLLCLWTGLSLAVNHGFGETYETTGIFIVETAGAYLLGRCCVRSPQAFRRMVQTVFAMALLLLPFAVYESLTGTNLALRMFSAVGTTFPDVEKPTRWGLDRVQGPFEHPILMGVFFGSATGAVFYVLGYGSKLVPRMLKTGLMAATGASALSSGPLSALVSQLIFIAWDRTLQRFRWRWYAYAGLAGLAYAAVDLLSNRNPFQVFIHYLAFNAATAYNRVHIFEWGLKNIADNPVFGLGFHDWERFWFMSPSMDMFWLIAGVRHGIPAMALQFLAVLLPLGLIAFRKLEDPMLQAYRLGYACSLSSFLMSGWTVHFWNATYVFFFFFLGSGLWLLDARDSDGRSAAEAGGEGAALKRRKTPYTRFPGPAAAGGAGARTARSGRSRRKRKKFSRREETAAR